MAKLHLTKKYETYPEYKDSGVEWLGKIPKDWNLQRLKYIAPLVTKKVTKESLQGAYIALENIETKTGRYIPSAEVVEPESIVNAFENTDVLFGKLRPYLAKVFAPTFSGASTGEFLVLRPKEKIIQKYLFYRLLSQELINAVNDSTYGAQMPRASWNFVGNLSTTLPSIEEQENIANHLDEKTALIDSIIEKKQRLIELLQEKRTSAINTLIVSARGEKGKLKNYIQQNPSKEGVSTTDAEDMVSFVPMEAISELGELQLQERMYKNVSSGFTYFRDGDVVLAKITPCYENGKSGVMKGLMNGFGFGTTEFMVLRPSDKILADYLYYVIFSDKFRKMGEVEMRGTAGQKRVTSSFVMNYELSIPNIKTQEKVVEEINKKMKMFGATITQLEASIVLLKEFKSSLISNAVTGKIKV